MKSSELLRMLKRDGWYEVRQSGSHIMLEHPTKSNSILFPLHGSKEMKKGTMQHILKLAEVKTNKR